MNKNIEQLAIQAGMTRTIAGDTPVFVNDGEIEKFADLIIKTCLDIVYYKAQFKDSTPEKIQHSADIIKTISNHFGV